MWVNTPDSAEMKCSIGMSCEINSDFEYWMYGCSTFYRRAMLSKHFHGEPNVSPSSKHQKNSSWLKVWTKLTLNSFSPSDRRISYLCTFWGRTLSSRHDGWVCSWSCSPRTQQTRYSFCCFPAFGWWSNDQTLERSMEELSLAQSVSV